MSSFHKDLCVLRDGRGWGSLTSFGRACILGCCYFLVENVKAGLLLDDFSKRIAAAPSSFLAWRALRESFLITHPSPKWSLDLLVCLHLPIQSRETDLLGSSPPL